jgi:small subunit ribosomal protein S20
MPHTRSAKKRLRQNQKRYLRNRSVKHAIKTYMRKVLACIENKDLGSARDYFRLAAKKIDKAAARRIIHPNKGARLKRRLAQKLAQLERQLRQGQGSS